MYNKVSIKGSYILFIVIILLISLTVNVYQNIAYKQYKNEFEQRSYESLEEIRYRNEAILAILDSSINANSISNDELLILYKNYNGISDTKLELWEHFLKYKNNPLMKLKKNSDGVKIDSKNQNYWRIGELVYSYLQKDIKENTDSMNLNDKAAKDFMMMRNLANDLNDFYINFYNKNCTGLEDEKRARKIIENDYWVDMLKGIEEINEKYVEYPFSYE
jgi:hypothetical protein